MTKNEAMQMALDWVEMTHPIWNPKYFGAELKRMAILHDEITSSLRTALAQPKEWVGLTITETSDLWEQSRCALPRYHTFKSLIEAKLKEKNA